ncbi:isoprenoid synthase domain-containing protein [Suillus placidus]|uniref:Isoprenoid synthase domain-containing protein n=1 Tax=Suillus placidus TaxID=48579 RepID=A0A9P7A698_9AGAM|nr:isoprenoid synthase domain-containing protein [Suillus placidus]
MQLTLNGAIHPIDFELIQPIQAIISSLLEHCDIPYGTTPFDHDLYQECVEEATRRGYPVENIGKCLTGGVVLASTAYQHITDIRVRVFVALITSYAIYLDDMANDREVSTTGIDLFNERFMRCSPQEDSVLDAFAELLRETPKHFQRITSNIIVTSILNAVTAFLLEQETEGMTLSRVAHNFPTFCRIMSGAADSYALFAFPPDLAVKHYIQSLPEMTVFVNNMNDILSFYKEELSGESVNRVSLLATCQGTSKYHVLSQLADATVDAHQNILKIIESNEAALNAYKNFSSGFVYFHTTLKRYKLSDLGLQHLAKTTVSTPALPTMQYSS